MCGPPREITTAAWRSAVATRASEGGGRTRYRPLETERGRTQTMYTWGAPRDARANENAAREIYEGTRSDPFRALLSVALRSRLSPSFSLALSTSWWKLAITYTARVPRLLPTGPSSRLMPATLSFRPCPSLLRPSHPLCATVTRNGASRVIREIVLPSPRRDIELRGGAGEDCECSRKGSVDLMQFQGRLEGLDSLARALLFAVSNYDTRRRRKLRRQVSFSGGRRDTL